MIKKLKFDEEPQLERNSPSSIAVGSFGRLNSRSSGYS